MKVTVDVGKLGKRQAAAFQMALQAIVADADVYHLSPSGLFSKWRAGIREIATIREQQDHAQAVADRREYEA